MVTIRAEAGRLISAIGDLCGFLEGGSLELDGHGLSTELCELLSDGILADRNSSHLVRVDSHPATDGTGDVLVSLEPSDLFLELLSALRTRNVDGVIVDAEAHGPFLS